MSTVHLTITKIQYCALNKKFLFCSPFRISYSRLYSLPLPYVSMARVPHPLRHTQAQLYYSTSSLTNQIAPFEGNNFGYCTRICHLWQRVMMQEPRACVHAIAVQSVAQLSWWISTTEKIVWWTVQLLCYTTWVITDIIDCGKVGLPEQESRAHSRECKN